MCTVNHFYQDFSQNKISTFNMIFIFPSFTKVGKIKILKYKTFLSKFLKIFSSLLKCLSVRSSWMFPAGPTYPSLTAVCCYLSMTYKGATSGVPVSHLAGTSDLPVKPDRWTDPACSSSAVVVRFHQYNRYRPEVYHALLSPATPDT